MGEQAGSHRDGAHGGICEDILHPRRGDPARRLGRHAPPVRLGQVANSLLPLRRIPRLPQPGRHHGRAALHPRHCVLRRLGEQGLGVVGPVRWHGPDVQRDRYGLQAPNRSRAAAVPLCGPLGRACAGGGLLHSVRRRREWSVRSRRASQTVGLFRHVLVQGVHLSFESRPARRQMRLKRFAAQLISAVGVPSAFAWTVHVQCDASAQEVSCRIRH
mmetsp:Transcript_26693/g.76929  ORF Transcript_26693/g.76929 Transcript_26693/m.76929 type:complete len:216 (+) Transcript_26693:662-1309(+)